MLFFKKKKKDDPMETQNIFCEVIWKKEFGRRIELYGTNRHTSNINVLCSNNIFEKQIYLTTRPSANIYIPKVIYDIDWSFIFKEGMKLKSFKLYFYNYMSSTREYSILMNAINEKNKEITDGFISTIKVFVDPYELTDNLNKFFRFAELYK